MNQRIYPRLPLAIAKARIDELGEAFANGGLTEVEQLVGVEHPRAAPIATGGRVADQEDIAAVRGAVMEALAPWRTGAGVARPQAAAFDLALGRVLHDQLQIVPSDAAHDETWSFLTLIVLPDVAVMRFPDMHVDRLLGGNRNVLRRPWLREEVLGDLLHATDRPLGEDELVGLFERTALSRNRALIRRLAHAVVTYEGTAARSEWARELYKRVTFVTGPRLLDALPEVELDELIRASV